jgi:uncharacterized phiE125 gp8 family phage protein
MSNSFHHYLHRSNLISIARIAEPNEEPISLADAKEHLRVVDMTDDDGYITALISAARLAVENLTGRALVDTVFMLSARDWAPCYDLPRGNGHTINSVVYDDINEAAQTVSAADYRLSKTASGISRLVLLSTFNDPSLFNEDYVERIRITFTAGYGGSCDVPQTLRQAVLYLVQHMYDNRSPIAVGVSIAEVPMTVKALAAPYIIYA